MSACLIDMCWIRVAMIQCKRLEKTPAQVELMRHSTVDFRLEGVGLVQNSDHYSSSQENLGVNHGGGVG